MASQKTNRREVGFTSCRGRSQKLRAFTEKELETVRAAKKLLSVLTFGGGSARAGGGCGGSQRSQICPHAAGKVRKQQKKTGGFTHFLAYKSPKTPFSLKSTLQDILLRRFLRNTLILKFFFT
jgi:hypothetical protein